MEDNKIVLRNENDEEQAFELVITLEMNDKTYVLLADDEHNGIYPFIYEYDEENGESLYPVEDEEEFKLISDAYDQLSAQAMEEADGCGCGDSCGSHSGGSCCCSAGED